MRITSSLQILQIVGSVLIIMLGLLCFVVIVIDEIAGRPIDNTIQTLLVFIIGVASSLLGVHTGSQITEQAPKNLIATNNNGSSGDGTTTTTYTQSSQSSGNTQ